MAGTPGALSGTAVPPEEIARWEKRAAWVRRSAQGYRILHDALNVIAWAFAIGVPFGLAMLLYLPKPDNSGWNLSLLAASGTGLALQILSNVIRVKERAENGYRTAAALEAALARARAQAIDKAAFLQAVDDFLKREAEGRVMS